MRMIHRQGSVVALAIAGLLASALSAANPRPAAAAPLIHKLDQKGVKKFWTKQRMARAIPLDAPRSPARRPRHRRAPQAAEVHLPARPQSGGDALPDRRQGLSAVRQADLRLLGLDRRIARPQPRLDGGPLPPRPRPQGQVRDQVGFRPRLRPGPRPYGGLAAKALARNSGWAKNNQHYDFGARS